MPVNGDTTFEPNETFTSTCPAPATPRSARGTGTGTILNDDTAAGVSIDATSARPRATAARRSFTFTVTPVQRQRQTVTVDYAHRRRHRHGAGSDYIATTGTLTFAPGRDEHRRHRPRQRRHDGRARRDLHRQPVQPERTPPSPAATGTGTILQRRRRPCLRIDATCQPARGQQRHDDRSPSRSRCRQPTAEPSRSTTRPPTAPRRAGSDYTADGGTLTFDPGGTTTDGHGPVNGDTQYEATRPSPSTCPARANATICRRAGARHDPQRRRREPHALIGNVSLAEGNSGTTNFVFTVTKTGQTEVTATVDYTTSAILGQATAGASCAPGIDYISTSGTLTFLPADTTQTITVARSAVTRSSKPTSCFTSTCPTPRPEPRSPTTRAKARSRTTTCRSASTTSARGRGQ